MRTFRSILGLLLILHVLNQTIDAAEAERPNFRGANDGAPSEDIFAVKMGRSQSCSARLLPSGRVCRGIPRSG